MVPISVIIITKDEGENIERTLKSVQGLTDDVIVVDSGSTDDTLAIAKRYNTRITQTNWDGYGANKNKGIALSKYSWILSLDADEVVDHQLFTALANKTFFNENIVYSLRFNVFIGNTILKYGQPGRVKKIRIFNKKKVKWNNNKLHENLTLFEEMKVEQLPGSILHYSYKDIDHCISKTNRYTTIVAEEMCRKEIHSSFLKIYLNPIYTFLLNYLFRRGFLDGFWGYTYAKMNSYYCFLKYAKLREMNKNKLLDFNTKQSEQLSPPLLLKGDQAILN